MEHDDDEAEDDHNIECAYLLKELKNSFKTGVPCQWRTFEIPAKEASSLYSLLHSCRPDGWIYDDAITTNCPLSILIESKIGNNQFSCAQLYRHLSGEHGYNLGIKARGFQNIISVTWENVLSQLEKLGIRPETITGQIYKQFKEYLIMSGEVLDLRKLNDHYDEDFAKNQFDLFLNKLDEAIAHSKIPLIRKSRRKFHPWDIYGIEGEKGKPLENPNFTISFSFPGGIGCSLTANNSQGFLKNVKVREFLEKIATNPDCEPRQRYRYLLQTNRLIDWKNGQQQGDKYQAFRFFVNFAEKQWQTLESINYLIDTADICRKKGAREQLISWEVDWVDINKVKSRGETPLRSANIDLFDNPNKLIKEIVDFYKELYPILLEMHKKL